MTVEQAVSAIQKIHVSSETDFFGLVRAFEAIRAVLEQFTETDMLKVSDSVMDGLRLADIKASSWDLAERLAGSILDFKAGEIF